jgi:uncharacterized protein
MINHIRAILVAGMLALSGVASAGPLEDGTAAYNRNDFATALKIFRPLAENGDVTAQYALGMIYQQGQGVAPDQKEAYKWFRLAADQGVADAEWFVGLMHANGLGIEKNETEAVKWYRLAAEQGYSAAQHFLGVAYANGAGVKRDDVRAYMWLELAAWQKDSEAAKKLDVVAAGMSPRAIDNAQMMAFSCQEQEAEHKYKGCE